MPSHNPMSGSLWGQDFSYTNATDSNAQRSPYDGIMLQSNDDLLSRLDANLDSPLYSLSHPTAPQTSPRGPPSLKRKPSSDLEQSAASLSTNPTDPQTVSNTSVSRLPRGQPGPDSSTKRKKRTASPASHQPLQHLPAPQHQYGSTTRPRRSGKPPKRRIHTGPCLRCKVMHYKVSQPLLVPS